MLQAMRTARAKALWLEGAKLISGPERNSVSLGQRSGWGNMGEMGVGKKAGTRSHRVL